MNYVDEIFNRANLQNISGYLTGGLDYTEISDETFYQRLEEASDDAQKTLEEALPEDSEYNKIIDDMHRYAVVTGEIYMEIGLKCGVMLAAQLFGK